MFAHVFANDEKSGFGVIAIEEVKQFRSDPRVGAIVKRERETFRARGGAESGAENLRLRVHRAISGEGGEADSKRGSSNEPRSHVASILPRETQSGSWGSVYSADEIMQILRCGSRGDHRGRLLRAARKP